MPEKPHHSYDSTIPAITDVLSRPQDRIALVFGSSRDGEYNALAFHINRAVRRIERAEDVITLADGDTAGFGYVTPNGLSSDGADGDDVFRVDADRAKTIVEYGFAIPQTGVYAGIQTGDGDDVNGITEGSDRDRGFNADNLPQQGVLSDHTSLDIPPGTLTEEIPTTALSATLDHGLVRIDSKQSGDNPFYFGFNNQSGGQVTVDITGYGHAYEVEPIRDAAVVKDTVQSGNRKVINYGGLGNTNPNLPSDWQNYKTTVGASELAP